MEEQSAEHQVLVVDDDRDVAEVVAAILGDEGYRVTVLDPISDAAVIEAAGRLEPDCVLLDGAGAEEYGQSWALAAALRARHRPIPTIMFTAHAADAKEGADQGSARARDAHFGAVLRKPFQLDELLAAVEKTTRMSVPFDRSVAAEEHRTEQLVAQLTAAGARDIRTSSRREWATFVGPNGDELQLYWWRAESRYLVARYSSDGGRIDLIGRYDQLVEAIGAAMEPRRASKTSDTPP